MARKLLVAPLTKGWDGQLVVEVEPRYTAGWHGGDKSRRFTEVFVNGSSVGYVVSTDANGRTRWAFGRSFIEAAYGVEVKFEHASRPAAVAALIAARPVAA